MSTHSSASHSTDSGASARSGRIRIVILVIMGVIISLFFVPSWGSPHGRLMSHAQDFAHFPLFALLTTGILIVSPWGRRPAVRAAGALAAAAILATSIELIQPLAGRTAALDDWLLGMAGSMAVAAVYMASQSASYHFRHALRTAAVVLIAVAAAPLAVVLADRYFSYMDFPLLDSFEGAAETGRWMPEGCVIESSTRHATHGSHSLCMQVDGSGARYPRVFRADSAMDWRGYKRLAMDIFLEGRESRIVWLRADDRDNPPYTDRAQTAVELQPGRNTLWIDLSVFSRTPGGRVLDLGHIVTVGFFLDGGKPGDTLYLDRMILSGPTSS